MDTSAAETQPARHGVGEYPQARHRTQAFTRLSADAPALIRKASCEPTDANASPMKIGSARKKIETSVSAEGSAPRRRSTAIIPITRNSYTVKRAQRGSRWATPARSL